MGTILRIRQAFIAIRKLALLVLKQGHLAKALLTLVRRFIALWSRFWCSWIGSTPLLLLSKRSTVDSESYNSDVQKGALQKALIKRVNHKSLFVQGQPIPTETVPISYRIGQSPETVNRVEGVAYSLYPLSHGSHGNSWTTLSQHISPSTPIHDVVNLANEPASFLHHSTTQSSRTSIHSTSSKQDDCPTEISQTLHGPCYLRHFRIKPVMPEDVDRYDMEKRKYCPSTDFDTTIELTIFPLVPPTPSQGWLEYVHPEGGRYFYHKDKRAYTDANIYEPSVLEQAMDAISIVMDFVSKNAIPLPEATDLVVDIPNDNQTNYYFANHETRSIFFLDTFETNDTSIDSPGRLRHHVEVQYWCHLSHFPHCLALSLALVGELKDIVLHFVGDSMTSPNSTAPYDLEVLYKILDITSNLETRGDRNAVGSMSFISRFMYIFASSKYWNYAGEAHARLDREQSIYGAPSNQRNWFMKSLSLLLFSVPNVHLKKLQQLWVDQIVYASCWDQMFKQLSSEWKAQILLAAILLNANIGLLIVQGEDIHRSFSRTPAQISGYISVATNIASIVMGLLLVKQTSTKRPITDAQAVQTYLNKRLHPRMGLETLAILYSLPFAFLIWGILYFLAAFGFSCFQNSNSSTRIIVGSLCAPIVVLCWWSYTSWGKLLQSSKNAEDQNKSDKQSVRSIQTSKGIISMNWMPPANLWIAQALSKFRRESHSEKTIIV